MVEAFVISTPNDQMRTMRFRQEWIIQIDKMESHPDHATPIHLNEFPAVMDFAMARRGISKSHRGIIQLAKDKGLQEVLILEDDVRFLGKGSLMKFLNLNKIIPKDCDLLFAGLYDGVIEKEYSNYARITGSISGLHCYFVKEKFFDKFLAADENLNIDFYLSTEFKPVIYSAYPFLAIQHDGYSYNAKTKTEYNYQLNLKYKLYDGSDEE